MVSQSKNGASTSVRFFVICGALPYDMFPCACRENETFFIFVIFWHLSSWSHRKQKETNFHFMQDEQLHNSIHKKKNTVCICFQVPCSLEYWDELQQAFVPYREFSLSESCACQLPLPSLSLTNQQKELVASDLWRIVLNNNSDGGDEQRWGKILCFAICCLWECMFVSTQWTYRPCAVLFEEKQRERECTQAAEHKELKCVPRPTSGVQEQGAGLEGVQIGLMRFPSTPSACQGPSGFLPAYLECI